MDTHKSDAPKSPDMVMCGDHPSFTKSDLNTKEAKPEDKEKDKIKEGIPMSYARISPTSCRGVRAASEHALRAAAARRARDADVSPRPAGDGTAALVQVALGSFRWPPYLLVVWVLVLVLTHTLHCLLTVLERALPTVKKCCQYFRTWTEDSWKSEGDLNQRVCPIGLACVSGVLYTLYFGLYAVYAVALWATEPLSVDVEEKRSVVHLADVKVTSYLDEVSSKTNTSTKQ